MPFIHVYAWTGRDQATKQAVAQSIVAAASKTIGAPPEAFTVVYQDVDKDQWAAEVEQGRIEPLRDMVILDNGQLV